MKSGSQKIGIEIEELLRVLIRRINIRKIKKKKKLKLDRKCLLYLINF